MKQPIEDLPENKLDLPTESETGQSSVRSLTELLDLITGRNLAQTAPGGDSGLAEILPFPFLALVGQFEMKLALILAVVNPAIGGVLLIGPRGTGKTTAVRSLINLLPVVRRSACFYGCLPEDIESGGMDSVCPDCARKYGEGRPLTLEDHGKLVELPLNARLDDVIGGLDERALVHERLRLKRGILAQADLNVLYADEVNLLVDEIVNAILDAAAQGIYTIRRGAMSSTYNARFTLIGSMNPEEGILRPQIMDRFGLRVLVTGLTETTDRLEAYQRVSAYRTNPRRMVNQYSGVTEQAHHEILAARSLLPQVVLPAPVSQAAIELCQAFKIDSLRAEITLLESARAYSAIDGRSTVELADLRVVAPLALRLRRSAFINQYFSERKQENEELGSLINRIIPPDL